MLLNNALTIWGGAIIDSFIGDPARIPHPVVGFGKGIALLEQHLNHKEFHTKWLRWNGIITVIIILSIAFLVPYFLLKLLAPVAWLFWPVNLWLMNTTIATKGLNQAGRVILKLLQQGNLAEARIEVGKIVGRDTANLSEEEIIRATVETIAENTVDGVISPLFFGFIGGAPCALLYRALNTLDSMVGYKNDRFRYFGWAAARLDDLANFIPARICAFLIFISAFLLRLNWRNSMKMTFRDGKKHPSPNGGWPESAVAGALGVRLGGQNYYFGVPSFRNYLGDPIRPLELEDIRRVTLILNVTVFIALVTTVLLVI